MASRGAGLDGVGDGDQAGRAAVDGHAHRRLAGGGEGAGGIAVALQALAVMPLAS